MSADQPARRPSPFLSKVSFLGSLLALSFVGACGGTELGGGTGPEGGTGPGDGGGVYTAADGETCIDIDVSTYDRSCEGDLDCISVTPGTLCSNECVCNTGATVSRSEQARYQAAISQLTFTSSVCGCLAQSNPICLNHQCSLDDGQGPDAGDAGCRGNLACVTEPTGPGVGFQGPRGKTIPWGSPCTGEVYYPDGAGWAICFDGIWGYTTDDPAALGGYVLWH
jgi:hypothetical protein